MLSSFRTQYWRSPFQTLCQSRRLSEFYVVDVENIDSYMLHVGCHNVSLWHHLADVWVVPSNQVYFFCPYLPFYYKSEFLLGLILV